MVVIDLAQARAWRLLRADLGRLADQIGHYRRIVPATHPADQQASDLQAIAGKLDRILQTGLRAGDDTRRRILDVKIRILLLVDDTAGNGPGHSLATALLDLANRLLALFREADATAAA